MHPPAVLAPSPPRAAAAGAASRRPRLSTLRLLLLAAGLALLLYWPTLGNSWAYDDIDYINQAAEALAGQQGVGATLLRPQGEHIVAGFRALLFASLSLFGVSAFPFRLLVLAAHAATAVFLGLLARRHGGERAAVATTALYVGACGLSSMWVWFPSGSTVIFALAALSGAMLLLDGGERGREGRTPLTRRRVLAGALVVLAMFTESTLAPLVTLPIAIDELERRRAGARRWSLGWFTVFCLGTAIAVSALASVLFTHTFGPRLDLSPIHGAPRALFLLLVTPFRLFFPGVSIMASEPGAATAALGSLLGMVVGGAVAALLVALWRREAPYLVGIAAATSLGPLAWLGLVGLGRWRTSYWELYEADRYFFPLLVPLALLAGAAAASAGARLDNWPRRTRMVLAVVVIVALGSELVLHRRAMLRRIPFDVYDNHERRFSQLELLAKRLETAAAALPEGAPPLEFPDVPLWFPEVHNGYIDAAVLMHVIADGAGGRLRLGGPAVGERDARILNATLTEWAREIGEPLPYLAIEDGRLTDAHVVRFVDFREGPQPGAVINGFFDWEGTTRWMGGRGTLRFTLGCPAVTLLLAAPMDLLQAAGIPAIDVHLEAVDEESGWSTPLGTVRVEQPGIQTYRVDGAPFNRRLGNGRTIHLNLDAAPLWRPAGTIPGSGDTRDLSVMVFAAGCE